MLRNEMSDLDKSLKQLKLYDLIHSNTDLSIKENAESKDFQDALYKLHDDSNSLDKYAAVRHQIIEKLLNLKLNPDTLVTSCNDLTNGLTLIQYAVILGDVKTLQVLIKHGADINICTVTAYNPYGNSLLHYAAQYLNFAMVQALLNANLDVNVLNKRNNTPLFLLTSVVSGSCETGSKETHEQLYLPICKLLLNSGADLNNLNTYSEVSQREIVTANYDANQALIEKLIQKMNTNIDAEKRQILSRLVEVINRNIYSDPAEIIQIWIDNLKRNPFPILDDHKGVGRFFSKVRNTSSHRMLSTYLGEKEYQRKSQYARATYDYLQGAVAGVLFSAKSGPNEEKLQPLPPELIEMISAYLSSSDGVRASLVCKDAATAAKSYGQKEISTPAYRK